jgi:hypothetical protein
MPNIRMLCTIEADMKDMVSGLQTKTNRQGNRYWDLSFSVLVSFRGTKMQAKLRWKDEVSNEAMRSIFDSILIYYESSSRMSCKKDQPVFFRGSLTSYMFYIVGLMNFTIFGRICTYPNIALTGQVIRSLDVSVWVPLSRVCRS